MENFEFDPTEELKRSNVFAGNQEATAVKICVEDVDKGRANRKRQEVTKQ